MPSKTLFFEGAEKAQILIVALHSYGATTSRLGGLVDALHGRVADGSSKLASKFVEADILVPAMPAGLLSFASVDRISINVLGEIDSAWKNKESYEEVIFIGHSLGALVARRIYIMACGDPKRPPRLSGETSEEPQSHSEHEGGKPFADWAGQVTRIVLLAGMNRGWRLSHHLSIMTALFWAPGVVLIEVLQLLGLKPLIAQIRKGAPFITNLRLQWLWMRQWAEQNPEMPGKALTIQMLGSVDDMVSPEDNIDLVAGHDFVYLDVPFSGHSTVVEMGDSRSGAKFLPDTTSSGPMTKGSARRAVLAKALMWSKEQLTEFSLVPTDEEPFEPDPTVTDVVFVIHGIRDKGYWTLKVARRVLELAKREKRKARIATETSSYGYFPIAEFLRPTGRRSKVEWLMDQYAEAVVRYPNANFSYIGHSNGTYLLAKALEAYPICRFENVVFAGSVVNNRFKWIERSTQVSRLLNIKSTADWVVAFFPKAFQDLYLQDIGSAGHDGFRHHDKVVVGEPVCQGGHGAALVEQNWDTMASFVLSGKQLQLPDSVNEKNLHFLGRIFKYVVRAIGTVAPLVWLIIAVAVAAGGWCIWELDFPEWIRTLFLIFYFWILLKLAHTA